jgi:hypothetical protein
MPAVASVIWPRGPYINPRPFLFVYSLLTQVHSLAAGAATAAFLVPVGTTDNSPLLRVVGDRQRIREVPEGRQKSSGHE